MSQPIHLLLVDDDDMDRKAVRRALGRSSLEVEIVEAADGASGLAAFHERTFDAVLLDYGLPDRDGGAMLREMLADGETPVPIIMLTGVDDNALALQLLESGAVDYLTKAEVGAALLERSIRYALARQQVLRAEVGERRRCARLAEEKSQLLQELEQTNVVLEARNRRLAELADTAHQFVDNVSHEFRTPLTVIKEFAAILKDGLVGDMTDEQKELLDVVLQRVGDLGIMVDDMLDTSKLEAGLLGMTREPCRIEEIIAHVRPSLNSRARERNSTLEVSVPAGLPTVWGDAEKIGRVIVNLVLNAFKFSGEAGAVRLWVRHEAGEQQIVVGVSDTGPGIEPEHLQVIFERFKQVGGMASASTRGFGLGLSIAKELVQLNLGEITVESEPGRGSTFKFTVPLAEPRHLLTRFIAGLEHLAGGASSISLIGVAVESPTATACEAVYRFLQQEVRASDLVFRTRPGRSLLVVPGEPTAVAGMLERLAEARRSFNRSRFNEPLPAIGVTTLGTWPVPAHAAALIARFEAEFPQDTIFALVAGAEHAR